MSGRRNLVFFILQVICSVIEGGNSSYSLDYQTYSDIIERNESSIEYDGVSFDQSLSSDVSDEFDSDSTEYDVITIEELELTEVTFDSLTVKWRVYGGNDTLFLIEWYTKGSLVGNITESLPDLGENEFVYCVTNLEPCTEYRIVVTPITDGPLKAGEKTGDTSNIQPSAPYIQTADPQNLNNALNVTWKVPDTGGHCIKAYEIVAEAIVHGEKHVITETTSHTGLVIRDLYPCTSYSVAVRAIDLDGNYGLRTAIQSNPTPEQAYNPPGLCPPFRSNSSAIMLNLDVFEKKNNCSIRSVRTSCYLVASCGYGFDPVNSGVTDYPMNGEKLTVVSIEVVNLSPCTTYECSSWIHTKTKASNSSYPVRVDTKQEAPSAPKNFKLLYNTNFTFSWAKPARMPGTLKGYEITVSWKPCYPVPDFCSVNRHEIIKVNPSVLQYTWDGGEGYSNYTTYINAQTAGGFSKNSEIVTFQSLRGGVPSPVNELECEINPLQNDTNKLETILTWNLPCSLRGRLKKFEISILGTREGFDNHAFIETLDVDSDFGKHDNFSKNLGELKPEYHYLFEVIALIQDTTGLIRGEAAQLIVTYPAAIPEQPDEDYMKWITLSPEKIQRSSSSAQILLPVFPDTNGKIEAYSIIVYEYNAPYTPAYTRYELQPTEWLNISSWKESMEQDFQLPYQVTEPHWSPYPSYIIDYGSMKAVKFTIGDDRTCADVSATTEKRLYCNGPLKPGTWYRARMRAFTTGGYADSLPITFKTNGEINVALIIGLVFGILFIGVCAALVLAGKSYFKKKENDLMKEDGDKNFGRVGRIGGNTRNNVEEFRRHEQSN